MFLALVLFMILYVITNHFLNKIRNLPPSPFPVLPIIGHLHLLKKPIHRSLSKISNQYGPVLLLQLGTRRVIVVSSPSAAEECFTKNDLVFAYRPLLLAGKHLSYNFRSISWAPYGDYWRNLRKISSLEILSSRRLQLLSNIRSEEVKLLIHRLVESKDEEVNMKTALFELMLNVMMRMIAGKRYYGHSVEEVEEAREFQAIVKETFFLITESALADFLPVLGTLGGLRKKLLQLQKRRDKFVQRLIEMHRTKLETAQASSDEKNKTMIEVLLSLQESEPDHFKDQDIKSLVLALLGAGTDTSAATLEWAMSNLLNNPKILKKAQEEIDTVVGHDRLVDESDMAKLPYLHCIITETMRMYPAGPLLVPRESSEECMVGGYHVPRGTMLLVNMWGIQRDPNIWEDPLEFKPERFELLDGFAVRDGFKLMPFGSGRRSCPGEGLAMRMVGLALGSIIQCFEWERVGKEMVDMIEGVGLTMPKAQPLMAKCKPRPFLMNLLSQI